MAESGEPLESNSPRWSRFPGWTMVGIAAAANFMSAPGQSYSVAAFKEPMRDALGISETEFSLAYTVATLVSGALVPVLGRLLDRFGARRILPLLAAALGLACLGMSRVDSLPRLYLAFSFVRSLGQGALTLVAAWLVGEWFVRRRGFATAVAGLGGSLSIMSIPIVNGYVIHNYGWETAWIVLGFAVWLLLLVPSLFVRNRPEDMGLLPDGDPSKAPNKDPSEDVGPEPSHPSPRTSPPVEPAWSVGRVLRDTTFWKLLCVPVTSGMVGTGLVFHAVSLLGSRGVSTDWALLLISVQAAIGTCLTIPAGWATDRMPSRLLLAAAMLFVAGSTLLIWFLPSPHWIWLMPYAAAMGIHGSILRSTGSVVWLEYYGRTHQGAIRGIAMAVMIFAAAAGPLPLALSIDRYQTYTPALALFAVVPTISAVLVSTARPPSAAE